MAATPFILPRYDYGARYTMQSISEAQLKAYTNPNDFFKKVEGTKNAGKTQYKTRDYDSFVQTEISDDGRLLVHPGSPRSTISYRYSFDEDIHVKSVYKGDPNQDKRPDFLVELSDGTGVLFTDATKPRSLPLRLSTTERGQIAAYLGVDLNQIDAIVKEDGLFYIDQISEDNRLKKHFIPLDLTPVEAFVAKGTSEKKTMTQAIAYRVAKDPANLAPPFDIGNKKATNDLIVFTSDLPALKFNSGVAPMANLFKEGVQFIVADFQAFIQQDNLGTKMLAEKFNIPSEINGNDLFADGPTSNSFFNSSPLATLRIIYKEMPLIEVPLWLLQNQERAPRVRADWVLLQATPTEASSKAGDIKWCRSDGCHIFKPQSISSILSTAIIQRLVEQENRKAPVPPNPNSGI